MEKERLSTMLNVSDFKCDKKLNVSNRVRDKKSFMIPGSSMSVGWWIETKR